MSKKHTLTLTVTFSLPEEYDDLVIGEIPADELPIIGFPHESTISLDNDPARPISARQAG